MSVRNGLRLVMVFLALAFVWLMIGLIVDIARNLPVATSGSSAVATSVDTTAVQSSGEAASQELRWRQALQDSGAGRRTEFLPNKEGGPISMVPVIFDTEIYGGGFEFGLDQRLFDHWGARKAEQIVHQSLMTIRSTHGSCRFPHSINVYWDREKTLQRERRDCVEGLLFTLPLHGEMKTLIVLFGDTFADNALIHELSHANVIDLGFPKILDEGLATLSDAFFDQMWYRQEGTFQEAIKELIDGRPRGLSGKMMLTTAMHQPGIEPRLGAIVPYHPTSLYQYMMSARTLTQFFLVASAQPKSYTSFFGEFIAWVENNPNPTMWQCGQRLRELAAGFPGERWEDISLFAHQPTEGLFAFVAAMPTLADQGNVSTTVTAGLVIGYRDALDELPPFVAVIKTSSRPPRRAAIPRGGFVGPAKDVWSESDTWIRVWKEGEEEKAVTIRLVQR